jgi:hypothetical protein
MGNVPIPKLIFRHVGELLQEIPLHKETASRS